jgi:glycosyltransferase involved in cell wall biosynthesis
MADETLTLLSIIIPTKNRQYTCLYAIESALIIKSEIIEVVIQDCSDSSILKQQIFKRFGNDKRIKYFYTDSLPSMTGNWNLAIANAVGKYICFIGDDDGVLPACLDVTKWMDRNKIGALLGAKVNYVWKDADVNSYTNGRLSHNMYYSGDIFVVDIHSEFRKKALNCGFGYNEGLANVYHSIVEKKLLDIHKENCGCYFSSTCPDVYNSMILPSYLRESYYVDYPFTMIGTSGSSNTNKSKSSNGLNSHFKDFKNLHIPEGLPKVLNAEVAIAEATIIALRDTKQDRLIPEMNLSVVYAKCAAFDLLKFFNYYNQYRHRKNSTNSISDFFSNFYKFLEQRVKAFTKNLLLKIIFSIAPVSSAKYIERYTHKRRPEASDILVANQVLKDHLTNNSMNIKYNEGIKKLVSKKMPWE